MAIEIEFRFDKPPEQIGAGAFGQKTQLFAAQEVKRTFEPYVPANNLVLSDSARVTADSNSGTIEYVSPYAHYQYAGELYVDRITGKGAFTNGVRFWSRPGAAKIPSGRPLHHSTARHPLATSHWDKAALTAHSADLRHELEAYIAKQL